MIIGKLVERAIHVSASVASFLLRVESVLKEGRPPHAQSIQLAPEDTSPEDLLTAVSDVESGLELGAWSSRLNECFSAEQVEPIKQRLAGLVLREWALRGGHARRPDILALTCQLLTNPDVPYMYDTVRFVVVLTLRSRYDIPYDLNTLRALRASYDDLAARFAVQSRRQRKDASRHETFLLDLLCLKRWVHRSLDSSNVVALNNSFQRFPLGVALNGSRNFGSGDWPQLDGALPDFASILNLAFSQPTGVPGLDEILSGFVPLMADRPAPKGGGLVTFIAGPPGSGKTSLCLAITSKMAELGSITRYVTTEEMTLSVEAKRSAIVASWQGVAWPKSQHADTNFAIVDGQGFDDLMALKDKLTKELKQDTTEATADSVRGHLYLPFPRVVAIDSLTALLQRADHGLVGYSERRNMSDILNELRELGACVFLVGSPQDCDDEGLSYLVDNVFFLGTDNSPAPRHPIRTMEVQKTRLQTSCRGTHVFHLSGHEGCSVSPSLHAALRSVKGRLPPDGDGKTRAVLWAPERATQLDLPMNLEDSPKPRRGALTIRERSQVLLYGRGSSGKARFAMALAFEPRVSNEPSEKWAEYLQAHADKKREITPLELRLLERSRVLVVSFLYGKDYYRPLVKDLFKYRFNNEHKHDVDSYVTTLDLYPGYIDPETLISRVRRQIRSGRLAGRPYTTVILDGVHNLLLQFPLLEGEPLLWPTLFRIFRAEGIDAISTFTFFKVDQFAGSKEPLIDRAETPVLTGSDHIFFQLLVGNCDYTFLIERPTDTTKRIPPDWTHVRLASSLDGEVTVPFEFWWDMRELRYKQKDS